MPTVDFTANGTWTRPAGATNVVFHCWGPGANGLTGSVLQAGDGGGGGAYAQLASSPDVGTFDIVVGTGDSGIDSQVNLAAVVKCGAAAAVSSSGGTAAASTGTIKFSGGNGGAALFAGEHGGGGGGGADVNSDGVVGADATAGDSGAGGAAGGGGDAGAGGKGGVDGGASPVAGSPFGGGGGGGDRDTVGGAGAIGHVRITYTIDEAGWDGELITGPGCITAASTYNWNHTVANASNRLLLVGIGIFHATVTVTSVLVNGVAMTVVRTKVLGASRTELWGLVAPTVGVMNIVVTLTGAADGEATAMSFNGVDQADAYEGEADASGTGGDATVNVVTTLANALVLDYVTSSDIAITVGAGQTERQNTSCAGSTGMSTEPKVSPGTVTMSWTGIGGADTWATVATAIKSASAIASGGGADGNIGPWTMGVAMSQP